MMTPMTKKLTNVLMIGLVAALATGCGDFDDHGGAVDDDCEDCGEWSVAEQEDGDDKQGADDNDDIEQVVGELEPCLPRAAAESGDDVPEIADEVMDAECGLEGRTRSGPSGDRVDQWTWEGSVLEHTVHGDGEISQRTEFAFGDELDEPRRVTRTDYDIGGWSPYHRTEEWVFDDDGRLEVYELERWYETMTETTATTFRSTTEQQWDGDRLTERTKEIEDGEETRLIEYEWDYDGDRLLEASRVVDGDVVDRASWSYEEGRPASVSRFVDGVEVEHQSWAYDEENLSSRTIERNQYGLGDDTGDESRRAPHGLDTYAITTGAGDLYSVDANPWTGANAHLDIDASDDCFELPASWGHGYPVDEASYHLGWSDDEAPGTNIGQAYLYGGYGYGYGNYSWYGHVGIATSWLVDGYSPVPGGDVAVEVTYDDEGRMVAEDVEYPGGHEVDGKRVAIERKRDFGEAGLERDAITVATGEKTADATLRFERNDDGNPVVRERYRDGELVAHQSWDYDGDRAVDLEVYAESDIHEDEGYVYQALRALPELLIDGFESEPTPTARYEREFDDEGRQIFIGTTSLSDGEDEPPMHTVTSSETFTEWGEAGPVEELQKDADGDIRRLETWEYDASGELLERIVDLSADGNLNTRVTYVRDDQGRVVEKFEEYSGSTTHTVHDYACSD